MKELAVAGLKVSRTALAKVGTPQQLFPSASHGRTASQMAVWNDAPYVNEELLCERARHCSVQLTMARFCMPHLDSLKIFRLRFIKFIDNFRRRVDGIGINVHMGHPSMAGVAI